MRLGETISLQLDGGAAQSNMLLNIAGARFLGSPFALRFQGSHVRPLGGKPLLFESRLYPGNEIVRGFNRGSLGPWAIVPGTLDPSVQTAGADTGLGLSVEYRIPVHGALSSTGFFDLG